MGLQEVALGMGYIRLYYTGSHAHEITLGYMSLVLLYIRLTLGHIELG